jgi:predicted MPP superfamily phosphohydrolase
MRILHITDFHYKSPLYSKFDQDKVIDKFLSNLEERNVDLIFFTGDLVFNGTQKSHFEDAFNALLEKMRIKLNLDSNQLIICPGNHDVDRTKILDSLNTHFAKKILTNDELNRFTLNKDLDYQNSLKTIENYTEFSRKIYSGEDNFIEDLYTAHIRNIDGHKTGIIAINSAWRSVGDEDEGNLLFPSSLIKEGLKKIEDTKCKILLVHHPLHWFTSENYLELQSLIHSSFNMLFSGHVHESHISSHFISNNGIFAHISPASFTYEKTLGFSIIEFDFNDTDSVKIERANYYKDNCLFSFSEPVIVKIPCGEKKDKQNQLRKKIISKYDFELNKANELLLSHVTPLEESKDEFLKLFSNPILRGKSRVQLSSNDSLNVFNFDQIYLNEGNYWILGNDKSGKTSILRRIQLHHLISYSLNGNVPFYIDFKEFENKIIDDRLDFLRLIRIYYELNTNDASSIVSEHRLRLLIDNYDPKKPLTKALINFLSKNPSVNYVICSSQTTSMSVELQDLGPNPYTKLFLHDLGRSEIRAYTNKWIEIRDSDREQVIAKVVSLCKQLEIPVNYWTISLLLLIHQKMNNDTSKNLFEILDLCVDEMLNKKYLVLTKSRVKFEQLKKICAELSHFLLISHRENVYSAKYVVILNFIETHIKENMRMSADSREILDYLILSGVLKAKDDDNYTFRLNGIFEYFLAYYLTLHADFKDQIISDDNIYLSFKNELEIYSGFKNSDEDFLRKILRKTQQFFENMDRRALLDPDESLSEKITTIEEITEAALRLKSAEPFTHEMQDALKEELEPFSTETEIKTKQVFDTTVINSDLIERYLSILSRVFRNTDEVKDSELINEAFDFILNSYIFFGFYLVDEIKETSNAFWQKREVKDKEISILKILTNIIPIVTQVSIYDSLGHYNVEQILKNKISELKKDASKNQYKLFILYLLLIDIDMDRYHDLVDDLMEILTKGSLKTSLVFKLNYYLAFKAYKKKDLEIFFKQRIQKAQLRIDQNTDKRVMQHNLEERSKRNIIKKQKDR